MKCSFLITKLLPHKTCYVSTMDHDANIGGNFQIAIHPFPCSGNENAAFYYVTTRPEGKILIEGEGYILTDPTKVARHRAMGRRNLEERKYCITG